MTTPVQIAAGEIGTKEATGRNDGAPSERYMGGRMEPWCGHFVAWCYRRSGSPLPGDRVPHKGRGGENPLASVAELEKRCEQAGILKDPKSYSPSANDLIFFADRAGSDTATGKGQRHVGLVDDASDLFVHTIEGNIGNKVTRRVHRLDDPRITGYASYSEFSYKNSSPAGGRPLE